jgi:hypothetical protein
MRTKKEAPRRKCVVCRGWFRPHSCATRTQLVCFKPSCRLRRRSRKAKERRDGAPEAFRLQERRRQRKHRRAKLAQFWRVSRAGLSPEALEIIDESVEKLAQIQAMSRARLLRDLQRVAQISLLREPLCARAGGD